MLLQNYKLDPCHYFNRPGLSRDSILEIKIKIKHVNVSKCIKYEYENDLYEVQCQTWVLNANMFFIIEYCRYIYSYK